MQKGIQKIFQGIRDRLPGEAFMRWLFYGEVEQPVKSDPHKENTQLEIEYGRRIFGGGHKERRFSFWSSKNDEGKVGRTLQPRVREEEVRRLQEIAERKSKRNILLYSATRRDDFNILKAFLQRAEDGAYSNLRHPEIKRDGISQDYFIGFQNGIIQLVEDIRSLYVQAAVDYHKEMKKIEEDKTKS